MKRFTCGCLEKQFKSTDQVYVGFEGLPVTEIPCIYRPKGKATLRRIRLETNYCPMCGAKLEDVNVKEGLPQD
ncbi:hypothetical protein [Aminipila luticellarii]|uniref:Uncharacterized protein n=1 Tax=Aminipila luticellarii TaxID=2507160 RepID=A0A410PYA2_9FIRM|nr:hypothetical protein [Aminipila luticellarii]QAT43929.1 hypothetical protein EQM06_12230 [Aminipila luticellarii]